MPALETDRLAGDPTNPGTPGRSPHLKTFIFSFRDFPKHAWLAE